MAFFLIIISISLGMAGLLWNTPLSFFLHWEGKEIRLHVSLRTFFGLVPIGMDMAVQYFPLRLYLGRRQLPLGKQHTGRRSWKGLGKGVGFPAGRMVRLGPAAAVGQSGETGGRIPIRAIRWGVAYRGGLLVPGTVSARCAGDPGGAHMGLPVLLGETGRHRNPAALADYRYCHWASNT